MKEKAAELLKYFSLGIRDIRKEPDPFALKCHNLLEFKLIVIYPGRFHTKESLFK